MFIRLKLLAKENKTTLYRLSQRLRDYNQAMRLGPPDYPTRATVYSWANQKTQMPYAAIDMICKVLQCTVGDVLVADNHTVNVDEAFEF